MFKLSLELKADLLMALEDFKSKGLKERDNGFDIKALDNETNDKVLLRVITEPESRNGYVGADDVEDLVATINDQNYDKGILVGNRFTSAAKRKLDEEGIQRVSDDSMPNSTPERLYLAITDIVNALCKRKCGKIPQKESDCKGCLNGTYSCKVRLLSDNALFHFERGWYNRSQENALQLLSMRHTIKD